MRRETRVYLQVAALGAAISTSLALGALVGEQWTFPQILCLTYSLVTGASAAVFAWTGAHMWLEEAREWDAEDRRMLQEAQRLADEALEDPLEDIQW